MSYIDQIEAIRRYKENPVKLTEKAASITKQCMAEEKLAKGTYMYISTSLYEGQPLYRILLQDDPVKPEEGVRSVSNGIKILADAQGIIYLIGVVIDFEESSRGSGFIFKNKKEQNGNY
jgi:Fe-S cluster assembly iron-binding protein IscA